MGLFGPSQAEKAKWALANQPIQRDQQFGRHSVGSIPEFDAVVYDAIQGSGRDPRTVDIHRVKEMLVKMFMTQLQRYCEGSPDLQWDNLLIVMERPDFSLSLLSDYLTTCRGRGVAAHDKLAEFMQTRYPEALAMEIRKGTLDLSATSSGGVLVGASAQPSTPPGWYPDPSTGLGVRWWDGQQWTSHHQP